VIQQIFKLNHKNVWKITEVLVDKTYTTLLLFEENIIIVFEVVL
jgi:hypothetical protein